MLLLGQVTDTQDVTGTVLEEHEVTVDEEQAVEAIRSFVGAYEQIPPMYSALKVNGKRLYELARAGKEVERKGGRWKSTTSKYSPSACRKSPSALPAPKEPISGPYAMISDRSLAAAAL